MVLGFGALISALGRLPYALVIASAIGEGPRSDGSVTPVGLSEATVFTILTAIALLVCTYARGGSPTENAYASSARQQQPPEPQRSLWRSSMILG
ncbi:MAG TPA: hypothetical protein VF533_14005 [Solirubrobacteraceae bacterium]|jgi:hypothetical protein